MGLASRILDSVTEALDIHLLKTLKTLPNICTSRPDWVIIEI